MKFSDLNIFDVGARIGLVGAVFSHEDGESAYLCMFPTQGEPKETKALDMDLGDWTAFIRQLDLQEVEVLQRSESGKLAKVILRKTQRIIEQRISWQVYKRDGYQCRYCAKDGVPLTVDHLVLWEDGGPSIQENLVASCRKCNRTRGNTKYEDWLKHPYYRRVSRALSHEVLKLNEDMAASLAVIEPRHSKRSRR